MTFTRLYLLVSGLTLVFGAVDLWATSPFMLKYEAAVTNIATGAAFVAGAMGGKPIIQEVAEQRGEAFPPTREIRAFFRLFTLVWAAYFFIKAVFYVWIVWTLPMLQAMALRSVIGSISLGVMIAISATAALLPLPPTGALAEAGGAGRVRREDRTTGPPSHRVASRLSAAPISERQQSFELRTCFRKHPRFRYTLAGRPPRSPVHAFELIGEHGARRFPADHDLEDVAFDLRRHRATDHHPSRRIVTRRRHDQCRTPPGLLMPGLGIEMKPNDIAGVRDVVGISPNLAPLRRPKINVLRKGLGPHLIEQRI